MKICYVSQNQLHLWENGISTPLISQRAEQYFRNLQDLEERHSWKTEGTSAQFQNRMNPYENLADNAKVTITSVAMDREAIYYGLNLNDETGSIQKKMLSDPNGPEGLLLSSRNFIGEDIYISTKGSFLSVNSIRGQRHIATLDPVSGNYDAITSGDTIDKHPVLSKDGSSLYYDAVGYARDENGVVLGRGPRSVLRLHLASNRLDDVLEDDTTNYCQYTEDNEGGYYVMTRPYTPPQAEKSIRPLGCLLFPWYAIRGFFTFFATIGKMKNGNGPQRATNAGPEGKQTVHLDGELVDIQKALAENQRRGAEYPGIVPASWKLEKGRPDGSRQVIAKGVLHYQLGADGTLYYTNGRHIIRRTPDGKEESLIQGKTITLFCISE
ncbi:MAG: hypothetical protein IKM05_02250 [Clostridia bacterium]|nr:hypothetical protein [Clostridia bacterium]